MTPQQPRSTPFHYLLTKPCCNRKDDSLADRSLGSVQESISGLGRSWSQPTDSHPRRVAESAKKVISRHKQVKIKEGHVISFCSSGSFVSFSYRKEHAISNDDVSYSEAVEP
jgi:hypothetical protein